MLTSNYNDLAEPHFGRGKRIRFWRNGDIYSRCYELYINPNRFRSWNCILAFLTEHINPNFGAVRKVFRLRNGKSVCCFEDLDPKEKYVVGSFKSKLQVVKNGYLSPSELELHLKPKKKTFYSADFDPLKYKFLEETGKRKLTIIFLMVSGQICQKPAKIVLRETDMITWKSTLNYLAKMIDLPDGIHYICTIFGDILLTPYDLQHGYVYVAVPFGEKFKDMDYMGIFDRMGMKDSHAIALNVRPSSQLERRVKGDKVSKSSRNAKVNNRSYTKEFKKKNGNNGLITSCACMAQYASPGRLSKPDSVPLSPKPENPIERRIQKICGNTTRNLCAKSQMARGSTVESQLKPIQEKIPFATAINSRIYTRRIRKSLQTENTDQNLGSPSMRKILTESESTLPENIPEIVDVLNYTNDLPENSNFDSRRLTPLQIPLEGAYSKKNTSSIASQCTPLTKEVKLPSVTVSSETIQDDSRRTTRQSGFDRKDFGGQIRQTSLENMNMSSRRSKHTQTARSYCRIGSSSVVIQSNLLNTPSVIEEVEIPGISVLSDIVEEDSDETPSPSMFSKSVSMIPHLESDISIDDNHKITQDSFSISKENTNSAPKTVQRSNTLLSSIETSIRNSGGSYKRDSNIRFNNDFVDKVSSKHMSDSDSENYKSRNINRVKQFDPSPDVEFQREAHNLLADNAKNFSKNVPSILIKNRTSIKFCGCPQACRCRNKLSSWEEVKNTADCSLNPGPEDNYEQELEGEAANSEQGSSERETIQKSTSAMSRDSIELYK